jgi:lysophospholipase L1-like esterase
VSATGTGVRSAIGRGGFRHVLLVLLALAAGGCQHAGPRPASGVSRAAPAVAAAVAPGVVTSIVTSVTTVTPVSPFEPEILAFEASDRRQPPPPGGIVFVGSSSFRKWTALPQAFPGRRVLNRGFGGSTMTDVLRFAPRIVLPAAPATVVVYAGDNDLAAGRTPAQVLADYRQLVQLLRARLPRVHLVVVSIKPSPSRWALAGQMRAANALLAQEVARDRRSRYVDVFTPMLGADGRPRPELYGPDALHMTAAGYALWRQRIAPALD